MAEDNLMKRIENNPEIFDGKPLIRGRRVAVEHITAMLDSGAQRSEILESYPFLIEEDLDACVMWAEKKGKGD